MTDKTPTQNEREMALTALKSWEDGENVWDGEGILANYYETIRNCLQTPAPEWMDISTAPKDGTEILIGTYDSNYLKNPKWIQAVSFYYYDEDSIGDIYGGWFDWKENIVDKEPTYWARIQPAPKSEKE